MLQYVQRQAGRQALSSEGSTSEAGEVLESLGLASPSSSFMSSTHPATTFLNLTIPQLMVSAQPANL
jgi:hypothetical protein